MRRLLFAFMWLALFGLILNFQIAGAATISPLDGFDPDVNGVVRACIEQPDGKILIGGDFTKVNQRSLNNIARLNPDGTLDNTFNPGTGAGGYYDSHISALAIQTNGKILAGGYFGLFNGKRHYCIARLNTDGSVDDSFNAVAPWTGSIHALESGKILVTSDHNLVQFNEDGSIDHSFSCPINGVFSIGAVLSDGKILVLNGDVYRLNPDGSIDGSFHFADLSNPSISALDVQPDGKIVIAGSVDNAYKPYVARINPDGSIDNSFQKPTNDKYGQVFAVKILSDGNIFIHGNLSSYNGIPLRNMAMLNPNGILKKTFELQSVAPRNSWAPYARFTVQRDGRIIIAGGINSFNGALCHNILRINETCSMDGNFNFDTGANSTVTTIVRDHTGKTLIGGDFTNVLGHERSYIARINPDGSLDFGFNADLNGSVRGIAEQRDGKLVIGGDFTTAAGKNRNRIARLNPDGTVDSSFDPGEGANGRINAIGIQSDGTIIVAGDFTSIGGISLMRVAALKPDGSVDTTFAPPSPPNNFNFEINTLAILPRDKIAVGGFICFAILNPHGSISSYPELDTHYFYLYSLAVHDGSLFAGGDHFYTSKPFSEGFVSKLNIDGSYDHSFYSNRFNAPIKSFAFQTDGKLIIGGDFDETYPNISVKHLARLNTNGSLDTSFKGSGTNSSVFAISVQDDDKILIGGAFEEVDGWDRLRFARINSDGTVDVPYCFAGTGADGAAYAISVHPDNRVIIGGAFETLNQASRPHLASLDEAGWPAAEFNPESAPNGNVLCSAAQQDGGTIIAGEFTKIGNTTRNRIAKLNAAGELDPDFRPGSGANGSIYSMGIQPDGMLLIGGDFTQFNGANHGRVARINPDGSLDAGFNPDANGRVGAVGLQPDGKVVIGGAFTSVGGAGCAFIARLTANGTPDENFIGNAHADRPIEALMIQPDARIVVAGQFHSINGVSRHHIARLDPDGTIDVGFNLDVNADIHTLSLQADGSIVLGGNFTMVNGSPRNGIARILPDGWLDATYDPGAGANNAVRAIALDARGKLLMGGDFTTINGLPRNHIARLSNPTAASQSLILDHNETVTWSLGGSFPLPYQVLFEHSYDGVWWEKLGWGVPMPGVGYKLSGFRLPILMNHYVRATGFVTGGLNNGSVSLVQSTLLAYIKPSRNAAREWMLYN